MVLEIAVKLGTSHFRDEGGIKVENSMFMSKNCRWWLITSGTMAVSPIAVLSSDVTYFALVFAFISHCKM